MNKGSILILTLWVLTLISLIAEAVSRQAILEYKLTGYALQESELRRKTEEAVWKAWAVVANDTNGYDWLEELWAKSPEEEGEGLVDEDRKVAIVVSVEEGTGGTEVMTIPESNLIDSIALGASAKIIEWLEKNDWQGVASEVELQMAGVDISSFTVSADEEKRININTVPFDLLEKIIEYEAKTAAENTGISQDYFNNPVTKLKQAAESRPFTELSQWFGRISESEFTGEELTAYQALQVQLEERFKVASQFFRIERVFSSSKITKRLTVVFKKGGSRPDIQFWHEERITESN